MVRTCLLLECNIMAAVFLNFRIYFYTGSCVSQTKEVEEGNMADKKGVIQL